uniref:neurotrypsin isoform X4 n=1 Tax=Pristiophorus japonicus TaxID=55135 RepID=UPI00398ED355
MAIAMRTTASFLAVVALLASTGVRRFGTARSYNLPAGCLQRSGTLAYSKRSLGLTESGHRCLHWSGIPNFVERFPNKGLGDHSFCRNPDGRLKPWCFIRNHRGRIDWAYCNCKQGLVRLQGGENQHKGRIEVYVNGVWGMICNKNWDNRDASVVCRHLGYGENGKAGQIPISGLALVTFHWSNVQCRGDEHSLLECAKETRQHGNCLYKRAAAVTCNPPKASVFVPIRLVGGSSEYEGRVEVYRSGQWGTVCDDHWDEADAEVVCRQLGIRYAQNPLEGQFEGGSGPIYLDDVNCSGQESSLALCPRSEWGKHDCSHQEDVTVICTLSAVNDIQGIPFGPPIRLMDGENKKEGRVEIFINGQWGTICDDGWTDKDATVVCRQLGYKDPAKARSLAYFGDGVGPIHMDNVKCTGTEKTLEDCIKQDIGTHNCRHSEDAGVICDYSGKKSGNLGNIGFASSLCGLRLLNQRQKRIIGGKNSLRGGWPWQAAIRLRASHGDGRLLCGATLIGSCWVLTAAHCFKRYGNSTKNYIVRVGDYHTLVSEEYEEDLEVKSIIIHKDYEPDANDYDVALIKLEGQQGHCIKFNAHVLPACLPHRRERMQKKGSNCYITGWGDTGRAYSKTLQQAAIPLLPKKRCEERYKQRFTGRMLCAGNLLDHKRVDSCQGDSGGPLMCERAGGRWVVFGVTSWGHGCGVKDTPGVYTRVSAFMPWIKRVTKL